MRISSSVRFDIPLRFEPIVLPLPDFSLRPVDSFAGNKTEQRFEPKSNLIKTLWQQFPTQPPWPTVPQAMEFFKDEALRVFQEAPGNFVMTDKIFHEKSRESALKRDEWHRWWSRFLYERGVRKEHAEMIVQKEWDALHERIMATKEMMYQREKRHLLERLKSLENFERARDHRWKIQREWFETQKWLIDRGFKVVEDYRSQRQMNLYTFNDPSLVARLPRQGKPLEEVLGKIHQAKVLAILDENLKWRFDTSFVTLPNGGIIQTQNGGGKTKENLGARIAWPLKEQRSERFQTWHETRFKIQSPNDIPIQAPQSQGELPQKIAAQVHDPILKERTDHHRTFHESGLMVILPNDSMTSSIERGRPPGEVSADISWPLKEKNKIPTKKWKDSDLYVRQGEQGFISRPHTGNSLEEVVGSIAQSQRVKRDVQWGEEFKNSDFGATPNGGFAPLRQSGDRPEKVSSDQASEIAHHRSVAHYQWLYTGKNSAPSRLGSASLDHIDFLPLNSLEAKQEKPPAAPPEFQSMTAQLSDHLDTLKREQKKPSKMSVSENSLPDTNAHHASSGKETSPPQENIPPPPQSPLTADSPSIDQELKAPIPRQRAIKAFQTTMENDAASAMGRLQSHVHMLAHQTPSGPPPADQIAHSLTPQKTTKNS